VTNKLLEMLNETISKEMQVSIQYMWQHVLWRSPKHYAIKEEFRKIAIEEMGHAEKTAERLFYLGEEPTTKPAPISLGGNLKEMLENNSNAEKKTIEFNKRIIKQAQTNNDVTTAFIFQEILDEEEEHHDTFQSLLEADDSI